MFKYQFGKAQTWCLPHKFIKPAVINSKRQLHDWNKRPYLAKHVQYSPRVCIFAFPVLDFSSTQFLFCLFSTRGGIFQNLLASDDYSKSKARVVLRVFEKYQKGWQNILIFLYQYFT